LILWCNFDFHRTPLHLCAWFGHTEIAKLLIAKGAKVNTQDSWGRTALHIISWFGTAAILPLLLEKEASVDIVDNSENTPLLFACQNNYPNIVEQLLEAGANTKAKNINGQTPISIAETDDKPEILELFQKGVGEKEKYDKKGFDTNQQILREQKQMNKLLEELQTGQEKHNQAIKSLKDRVFTQENQLTQMHLRHSEMKRQLQDMDFISTELTKKLKDLFPAKKRFTVSKVTPS